jgi:2-methylcitrate dehydratase PrpD
MLETSPSLTLALVRALREWAADAPELLERSRALIRDGLSVAAAGACEEPPRIVASLERELGTRPQASVIGHGFRTGMAAAARINGMSMHVLDFEPMWKPPNHALSTVLPALLAVAEWLESGGHPAQGARVARAMVKGVEVQARLRQASGQFEPAELTLHPPGIVGPIGSAVACADLLGLDEAQWVNAIGIAASRTGGLLANVGTMTKCLHCGDASAHGLEAAILASTGFTASSDALGGEHGFGRSYFGNAFEASALTPPAGTVYLLNPGPAWKLFPSQYATHFAITAALALSHRVEIDSIERVLLTTPFMPYIDRPTPASGLDGKFSYQYCAAVALLDGSVGVNSFTEARRTDPRIQALLRRTVLRQDRTISGRFDKMHVQIEVQLHDGSVLTETCHTPLGSWEWPFPAQQLQEKARSLLTGALSEGASARLLDMLQAPLQTLSVSACMRILCGSLP